MLKPAEQYRELVLEIEDTGRRVYIQNKEIKPFLGGMGMSIISTSQGVMTEAQARRKGIGGEVLLQVC